MNKWSSFLVKTSISRELIDECRPCLSGAKAGDLLTQLSASVESSADLRKLKAALKLAKPMLPGALFGSLHEELAEIAEDAKWRSSSRGAYVIAVNEWIQPFHSEFRSVAAFAKVVIGGHSKREVIFLSGIVSSREVFEDLMTYVDSKKPPFKVMADVRLGSWNGEIITL